MTLLGIICLIFQIVETLLTLAIAAVPTEVTPARVLKLPVAFGADADHVGHDGARYGFLV